jgi:hypothetical protein
LLSSDLSFATTKLLATNYFNVHTADYRTHFNASFHFCGDEIVVKYFALNDVASALNFKKDQISHFASGSHRRLMFLLNVVRRCEAGADSDGLNHPAESPFELLLVGVSNFIRSFQQCNTVSQEQLYCFLLFDM